MAGISPLAPARFPNLPPLAGIDMAVGAAPIRYHGRDDVLLVRFDPPAAVAGVFTRSSMLSAPVEWCQSALTQSGDAARAAVLVVNSGNANAFNGRQGRVAVEATVDSAASLTGCRSEQVFVASTGVIGEVLPHDRLTALLPALAARADGGAWENAARAIMTTDTFPKGATARTEIDGVAITINGIAKGSGMIAPDMATMLAFIFTDAPLPSSVLQALLSGLTPQTFNAITVDTDTSTSDTVLLFGSGSASLPNPVTDAGDRRLKAFRGALEAVMLDLAQQIVRDGEGASKFITVNVSGAKSARAAKKIAFAVANSPLVKTAIAGEDANWGRIVMAVGKSGEQADRDALKIWIGDELVTENGFAAPSYDEAKANRHLKGKEVTLCVDVGVGRGRATVWTCDLTHDYIAINADYRS